MGCSPDDDDDDDDDEDDIIVTSMCICLVFFGKKNDTVCLQILCAGNNPISMTPMKAYHATSPHKCKHTDM